jgi:hypothetical protein
MNRPLWLTQHQANTWGGLIAVAAYIPGASPAGRGLGQSAEQPANGGGSRGTRPHDPEKRIGLHLPDL